MSNVQLDPTPATPAGVAGPTDGLPGPDEAPFVPQANAQDLHFAELVSVEPRPFLEEADALADALLDAMPTIREAVIARVPARTRPMASFDLVNEALMRYLRARRA